jgi:DMSO/TMAO reductase YedYZ molybdopterin-dependent catalytic subunit
MLMRWTRRKWMAAIAAPAFAQTTARPLVFPGKRPMLVHNDIPEDLESPPEYLDTWITPNDAFFVRQHLPRPKVTAADYRLELTGAVKQRTTLTLDDLRTLPQYTVPATLECAGNGRGNFRPRVPGLQWMKGAIGNAEWRGPRLSEVLAKAGVSDAAMYADFDGADKGVAATPDFIRSIPVRKVMHEATILALQMNGEPLPDLHGAPARLIVPGWDGASWVKWVTSISLSAQANSGFYMNPAYRYPRNPVAPGMSARPEEMEVIEGMTVMSFFARPAPGARMKMTPVTVTGAAYGGEERVVRIEISTDGGAKWVNAELSKQDFRFAWRTWRYEWKPARPGHHVLCCRATDSRGRTQPIEAEWNPSGYLYNAIERLSVVVEA